MKRRIECKLSPEGYITNVEFGDSEVHSVHFSLEEVRIEVNQSVSSRQIVINCIAPSFFAATSDHLQNIVERIGIFLPERGPPKKLVNSAYLSESSYKRLNDEMQKGKMLLIVEPISGIDMMVACKKIELWEKKRIVDGN